MSDGEFTYKVVLSQSHIFLIRASKNEFKGLL